MLTLILLLSVVNLAWAKENTIDQEKRLMILNMFAYGTSETSGGTTYNKNVEQDYLSMSDKEFEKAMRTNLESVITKKEKGAKITWNRDFAEKVVKDMFPDLYLKIDEQIKNELATIPKEELDKLEKVKQNIEKGIPPAPEQPATQERTDDSLIASYNPGNITIDFVYDGKNVFGMTLWSFHCQMYWAWDTTKITTVLPSTWGQIFAPFWYYDGVVSNTQYFINPTSFYKRVVGQFHLGLEGTPVQYAYPWHSITVYAGGQWDNKMGCY